MATEARIKRFARPGVVGLVVLVGCGRTLVELGPDDSGGAGGNAASSGVTSGGVGVSGFSGNGIGGSPPATGGAAGAFGGGAVGGFGGVSPLTTPARCDDDNDGQRSAGCGGPDCNDRDPTIPAPDDWNAAPGSWSASPVAELRGASSLAVGPDDIAHYAFAVDGQLRHLVQTSPTTWTTDLTVYAAVDHLSEVRMALDAEGKARILYGGPGGPANLAFDRGDSWGVMPVDTVGEPAAIAVGPQGVVHILYVAAQTPTRSALCHMAGDEAAIERGLPTTIIADNVERVSLAVGADGRPHVVYSRAGRLSYGVKTAESWNFEELPIRLYNADIELSSGGLTLDAEGTPRLALVHNGELYYFERQGEWLTFPIPDEPLRVSEPYLAVDAQGLTHMLVPGYDGQQSYIVGRGDDWTQELADGNGSPSGFALDRVGAAHFSFRAATGGYGLGYSTNRVLQRDGVDRNCDRVDGIDEDGDGWAGWVTGGGDCDDHGGANPWADEIPGNGVDENCDGLGACALGLVGPTLVDVIHEELGGGSFCIDATFVTNGDYLSFLASEPALPRGPGGGPYFCISNSSAEPQPAGSMLGTNAPCPGFDPYGAPGDPVVCVDWCDAWTYCAWVGKRLCRDGNAADMTGVSEWRLGCPSVLSGVEHGVFEWQDDCGGSDSGSAACIVFGSSGSEDASASERCRSRAKSLPRDAWAGDVGFRCCTD